MLHSFKGGSGDGEFPDCGPHQHQGHALWDDQPGARSGDGTIFSITPSGKEAVLYSSNGSGGRRNIPEAGLINVNGTLYGTTHSGGARGKHCGCGAVFAITTSGTETLLHSFAGGKRDGKFPQADLINVKGTLYGTTVWEAETTTERSSQSRRQARKPCSTASRGREGRRKPRCGPLNVKGTLYGTTRLGGVYGNGTIFAITTSGTETLLHSFGTGSDGYLPYAGLINVKGTLYGTTWLGGAKQRRNGLRVNAVKRYAERIAERARLTGSLLYARPTAS